jgi:hypothetical protein
MVGIAQNQMGDQPLGCRQLVVVDAAGEEENKVEV